MVVDARITTKFDGLLMLNCYDLEVWIWNQSDTLRWMDVKVNTSGAAGCLQR